MIAKGLSLYNKKMLCIVSVFLFGIIGNLSIKAAPMTGAELYRYRCAACHGYNGDGKGSYAKRLNTQPRDFTKGPGNFRYGTKLTQISRTITIGTENGMPPMGYILDPEQINLVALYIRSLVNRNPN